MTDASFQQNQSPARRRQGRRQAKAGGQKAYASENDAGVIDASQFQRLPQTPGKGNAPSPLHHESSQSGSRQKTKNKPKSKNNVASPESPRAARQTPPPQQRSASSKSAAAFAGATFHASPAPSALPIPSFLSKAVGDSPLSKGAKDVLQEPSPPATDTEIPTPHRPTSSTKPHESPLDFMFRAHREETERRRRESFHGQPSRGARTTSPPSQSPFELSSSPKASSSLQSRYVKQQYGSIGTSELDGTPGRPLGPAFSTPYHERIRAARGNPPRPEYTSPEQTSSRPTEDPTEALKRFLFSGNGMPPSGPSNPPLSSVPSAPIMNNYNAPSVPAVAPPTDGRANNIQAMENDLRRILKLDMASDKPSVERRLF
ncbi:hypothetical protein HJFPF1_11741 [Paramyrothecium foliicola]|nr:hypothetical protein HJFPF1_11741 [Paramyrothecium foliicola]